MIKVYDPIERTKRNPKSLRAAINAKCWDCQGRDADPSPRWRIGNCEIPDCPLYNVRPYQNRFDHPMPKNLAPQSLPGKEGANLIPDSVEKKMDSPEVREEPHSKLQVIRGSQRVDV
jgi:hypothetical protein